MANLFIINFYNFFFNLLQNYLIYFLPEIFLTISILSLVSYKILFKQRFSHVYSIVFIFFCLIFLINTIFLIFWVYSNIHFQNSSNFFSVNYKISVMKIIILSISTMCLLLFRHSLTKSRTNCLEYLICYLFINLVCLFILMVNTSELYILLILFEFLTICFYILSSFNYENYGFLLFRVIPVRKLLYFSFFLVFVGIVFLESYKFIDVLYLSHHLPENVYAKVIIFNKIFFLVLGIIFILISLLLKMVVFHSPTEFIYYKKTPAITIIYMHLVPKIIFFYFISEFVYTNYYFLVVNYWVDLVILCTGLCCLIISIGMRRLFLKHFMEYLSLVNSGYLLLCFVPLTYGSLHSCIYFIFFYILVIFSYGGVLLFMDSHQTPGRRPSFDTIFSSIEKQDYYTIISSIFFFFFFGLPPTRRDYPCSRGIPFNGLILQWLLVNSLLSGKCYVIVFFLIIFNIIIFFFYVGTIIPFWYKRRKLSFLNFPKYLNLLLVEFIIVFLIFIILTSVHFDNNLILNFLKTFYFN